MSYIRTSKKKKKKERKEKQTHYVETGPVKKFLRYATLLLVI